MSDEILYSKSFPVLWSDLDPNGHVRAARYLEYAAEMPFQFLIDYGFDLRLFAKEQVNPVTYKQEIEHIKEVRFGDQLTIEHKIRGLSPDASKWSFCDRIIRRDGKEAAIVNLEGAFFNLNTRKVSSPPIGLLELISRLSKDESFSVL